MTEPDRVVGQLSAMSIQERAQRYLACCDPGVSGSRGHDVLFRVCCALVWGFALSTDLALRLLKEAYNPRCVPPWSERELEHKITGALAAEHLAPYGCLLAQEVYAPAPEIAAQPLSPSSSKWPPPDLEPIDAVVRSGPGCYELWEASPYRLEDEAPQTERIVDVVFPGDPLLCCGQTATDFATKRRSAWRNSLGRQAYIVPNPMLRVVDYTLEGNLSEHTLAATAARVYQVVEFDFKQFARDGKTPTLFAPLICGWLASGLSVADACAALLLHLARLMPLALVVHSAGVSLHGWFRVFGVPRDEQLAFFREAVRLGADYRLWTRSQFTRVPDGTRENGARQICFYLNPENCVSL
jgi:hypothetical protein